MKLLNSLTKPFQALLATVLGALSIIAAIGLWIVSNQPSIHFQSSESVTETGAPVFNEIRFYRQAAQDIWIMRQSHNGNTTDHTKWDRLAIVVTKNKKVKAAIASTISQSATPTSTGAENTAKVARFYQLVPGSDIISDENEIHQASIPLKARCFACHSNGPRAIRMNTDSAEVPISIANRFKVALLNLRIKTYGPVTSVEGLHHEDGVPFSSHLKVFSQPLQLKSCVKCHAPNGLRNPLTLEQLGTAAYLVKQGFMPPFPFAISEQDKKTLVLKENKL